MPISLILSTLVAGAIVTTTPAMAHPHVADSASAARVAERPPDPARVVARRGATSTARPDSTVAAAWSW